MHIVGEFYSITDEIIEAITMLIITRNSTRYFRLAQMGVGLICLVFGSAVLADLQVPIRAPDAGAIMRNQPTPLMNAPSQMNPLQVPTSPAAKSGSGAKIIPRDWDITGNTLISTPELLDGSGIRDYLNQPQDVNGLAEAAQKVAMYYRAKGFLVRAWLPEQTINPDGKVKIRVVEGRMGDVNVAPTQRVLSNERVTSTLFAAQPQGEILGMDQLERGLLLLNDLPGVVVTPTLKQGSKPGTTDLELKVDTPLCKMCEFLPIDGKTATVNGILDYANAGVNSVGAHQFGGSLFINNPFGIGDQGTFRLQGGSGNVYGRITYTVPVGYSGLRVGVAGSGMYYTLGDVPGTQFSKLNADGDAWVGGIFASYPIVRSSTRNLYAMSGFDTRRYHNVSDPAGSLVANVLSDKTINVGYVGLQGDSRDQLLGGGFNNASIYMSAGYLDLSANQAYRAADLVTAQSAGNYQKVTFTFSRLQYVADRFNFWANFAGQIATTNLDSSEKFSLGGPYGVRAYPVNEALADEGYLMNFEMRYDVCKYRLCDTSYGNIFENVQLVGFIDHGGVTLHNSTWTNSNITYSSTGQVGTAPNNYTLSGGGFGINWISPGDFALRFSVAQRIGTNPYRSANGGDVDGTHNTPQFWAQLSKYF